MSDEAVMSREELKPETVAMLLRTLRPIELITIGFDPLKIDLNFGAGILENKGSIRSKCVWDKDGKRYTFSIGSDGFSCASVGREPDPYYVQEKGFTGGNPG